jgi:hypothetical protein
MVRYDNNGYIGCTVGQCRVQTEYGRTMQGTVWQYRVRYSDVWHNGCTVGQIRVRYDNLVFNGDIIGRYSVPYGNIGYGMAM